MRPSNQVGAGKPNFPGLFDEQAPFEHCRNFPRNTVASRHCGVVRRAPGETLRIVFPSQATRVLLVKPTPTWLCVLETDDSAGPRRDATKPNLKVVATVVRPGEKMASHFMRKGAYRPGDVVSVRYDLMPEPQSVGGRDRPFVRPEDDALLKTERGALRQRLEALGYTVNQRFDAWSLYVIELDGSHLPARHPGYKGYVYVGQTSQPVEKRIEQHRLGKAYPRDRRPHIHSRIAHKYFRRPRLDLIPVGFPKRLFCLEHALQAESLLRRCLEDDGFKVEGGTECYKPAKTASSLRRPIPSRP
jgi:hypothetical protein